MFVARHLAPTIEEALADTPVVVLSGPRQAGKSTLAERLVRARRGTWLNLDEGGTLNAAKADPAAFVSERTGLVGIDEVQRVPELLLAIKAAVDRHRAPGRFLLTGSTRVLGGARLADSLAGRMEVRTLWPFTQAELERSRPSELIDLAFTEGLASLAPVSATKADLMSRVHRGGYLPAIERTERRRSAWYDSYLDAVIDREVRSLTDAAYLQELPRMLRLVAARTSNELNVADLARDLHLSRPTTTAYLAHLEAVFLLQSVPAWSTNVTSRVVRRPKVTLTDTGFAARLLGGRVRADESLAGRLLETFVTNELRAQAEWSDARPSLFHLRDHDGVEVDLVLEARLGDDLAAGIVLCTNPDPVHLGGKLWMVPVAALWSSGSKPTRRTPTRRTPSRRGPSLT